ncbi:hypothetical protein GUJ93_ZPchr0006g43785 [Zizania palustris]|uniref:Uncharacterized protein n=1 Tax=Zizania palustris TaxID=103762 RepID=A0A8J5W2G6_ZIZPA|nr:hypothetical protein GUJ93_ZPchr0006g43785 [Zizania palustris]
MDGDQLMLGQGGEGGAGFDQEMGSEAAADGVVVLLMELLDEEEDYSLAPAPAATTVGVRDGGDRLSRVMRSLEAEIGGGAAAPAPATVTTDSDERTAGRHMSEDGGGESRLQEYCVLTSGFDGGYDGYTYGWPPELPLQLPVAAREVAGDWYMYGDGGEAMSGIAGYEVRDEQYCYYGDASIDEQVYSPLWEP